MTTQPFETEDMNATNFNGIIRIANKIQDKRKPCNRYEIDEKEWYGEDETYHVDIHNKIIGCNITVEDYNISVINDTPTTGYWKLIAEDHNTGDSFTISLNVENDYRKMYDFIQNYNIPIKFYKVKLSKIGSFYKPKNKSTLTVLLDEDVEMLQYLLTFLQQKGIIKATTTASNDDLETAVALWNELSL